MLVELFTTKNPNSESGENFDLKGSYLDISFCDKSALSPRHHTNKLFIDFFLQNHSLDNTTILLKVLVLYQLCTQVCVITQLYSCSFWFIHILHILDKNLDLL